MFPESAGEPGEMSSQGHHIFPVGIGAKAARAQSAMRCIVAARPIR